MKQLRLQICIAAVLGFNIVASACIISGDSPHEYSIYYVSDNQQRGIPQMFHSKDCSHLNLKAWADLTSFKGDLCEIEKVVYKYSVEDLLNLYRYGNLPDWDLHNKWVEKWSSHNPYAEFLLLAKQCEVARAEQADPWYYPADRQHGFATFEELLEHLDSVEENIKKHSANDIDALQDRFCLQRIRLLFTIGRYDECINVWNDYAAHLPQKNIMRTMIEDYVAGAYYHIGDTITAKKMYIESGNYAEIANLLYQSDKCWANVIKEIYDINPDCAELVAGFMQEDLSWLNPGKLQKYYIVMKYITDTKRSKDMAIWYYTKAFIEDQFGYSRTAMNTITLAERCKTTEFMRRNIRLLRMYLDAKMMPVNDNYEHKLYTDLCWLDTLIRNNITQNIRSLLLKEENLQEYSGFYSWHKMQYCYSFYYYNDIMRKIIICEAAPRLINAGRKIRALQLYNYADNILFKLTVPQASHCFFNYFFGGLYHHSTGKEIEAYIHHTLHPKSKLDQLLNNGSYIDTDYFYDIAGTVYLREQNYTKALECLSKVSTGYQKRLHTAEYMKHDPFDVNMTYSVEAKLNYKFNFAQEMCSLQKIMNDNNIDVNRRANAKLRFAIGLRNSYFYCWPLTQYSYGLASYAQSFENWMNCNRKKTILKTYNNLRNEALAMFNDDEAAAAAQYQQMNTLTVIRQYPKTKTAEYIREHCDTYYDYHDNYFTDLNNAPYYHCIEK